MRFRIPAVLTALASVVCLASCNSSNDDVALGSKFTGETLTLLYVSDVSESVTFYEAVGFDLDYFYDYETDLYMREWKNTYPPEYAEVIQPGIRIGLTTAEEQDQVYGGGVRHYFIVENVDSHFEMIRKNGVVAIPNVVEVRPWMSFITLADPDDHQIVFGTKNQAYYDQAKKQIRDLERP